ncbi:DUF2231 domain-containing protein [Aestuariivirga litoralis]|uniref:DUF2231 domain-containing protein n=1 Tax=Aestuariivirga litoralis TaxID=2650924 RepID=UPI0018C55B99|nr:DUF2231 domain-containing protein [Aestuariivirga litoralis]MBG1231188.1 hypothetical protein [Aestuariivirga litoralis]
MTDTIFEARRHPRESMEAVRASYLPVPQRSAIAVYLSGLLLAAPLVCFTGALLADIAYVKTFDIEWSNFAAWPLAFGMVFLAVLLLAGVVRFLISLRRRKRMSRWLYAIAILAAAAVGLFDNFIHTHDGWTSVWPTGIALSAATVALLVLALMFKLASLFRNSVGVAS